MVDAGSVLVVGAGIVGLSSALHLARSGYRVTVVERGEAGRGASWGNAGWICPGLVAPLTPPGAWRSAVGGLLRGSPALSVPRPTPGTGLLLTRLALQMTEARFHAAVQSTAPLVARALGAYDDLRAAGVDAPLRRAPITVGCTSEAEAEAFAAELAQLEEAGAEVSVERAEPGEAPFFSDRIRAVLAVHGQAYVDPGRFGAALRRAVLEHGVELREHTRVVSGHSGNRAVSVLTGAGEVLAADRLVVCAGAWTDGILTSILGARARVGVHSGRGYSFSAAFADGVDTARAAHALRAGPVYLPGERTVLTPYGGGVRVAGTMEFAAPDAPARRAAASRIAAAAQPYLRGVDLSSRRDEWVGPRPVTADGRPVIRRLDARVAVAAGHGMWGMALGPATGEAVAALLARS
ncbi:FAD-dependent oxidoreductase [Brevibacterium sp. 5221]|uniref:FAD-dependent oxidoreductase n=1 Tax=Brevibacterium rongguiense TaxID=2695267 RepID=A0A6N9H6I9_9MICO|nr:FAD-dependent oxidoreductase [Brevibacterium rongguiense]MYM19515.1 FAD-dependent oxidoreductase [Brevibacterium rongguiense]